MGESYSSAEVQSVYSGVPAIQGQPTAGIVNNYIQHAPALFNGN